MTRFPGDLFDLFPINSMCCSNKAVLIHFEHSPFSPPVSDLIASNQTIPETGSKGSILGCRLAYWGVNFRLAKLDGQRKGIRRSGERKEDSSNPYQGQEESFLWPGPGKLAFEKSFEY